MGGRRQPNRYARRNELQRSSSSKDVTIISPGAFAIPLVIPVPTWTSASGRWYYDLVHGLGRNEVFFQAYDTHTNQYINVDQLEPLTPTSPGTLRIWLTWQPAANRIRALYF
jgi:hypothetical protein